MISEIGWSIGSGDKMRFWILDSWVDGFSPLFQHTIQNASENEKGISVVDMVLPNKQWNWEAYARFLPM